MFIKNTNHLTPSLFSPVGKMNTTLTGYLKRSWSDIFYDKFFSKIDENHFAVLYNSVHGRANFPVNILAGLEVLKEIHDLSDEELCANYHFNYLYHRAFGIEDINLYSFAIRTLYHFRQRLNDYAIKTGKDLFSELFKDGRDEIIKELGINTETQRLDSVMIGANIKNMSRITLFHKVLSNLVKDITETGIEISNTLKSIVKQDEEGYAYRLKKSKIKDNTIELGNYLYIYTERFKFDTKINCLKSFEDAMRLLSEQCNIKENFKVELKESKDISSSSMQNPADTDATYRTKSNKAHKGYSTMAAETCDKSNPIQVITHIETVANNVDDAKILADSIATIANETDTYKTLCKMRPPIDQLNVKAKALRAMVPEREALSKQSAAKCKVRSRTLNLTRII